jgi:hypothetical protein
VRTAHEQRVVEQVAQPSRAWLMAGCDRPRRSAARLARPVRSSSRNTSNRPPSSRRSLTLSISLIHGIQYD